MALNYILKIVIIYLIIQMKKVRKMSEKKNYRKPVLEYCGAVSVRTLGNTSGTNPDCGLGSTDQCTNNPQTTGFNKGNGPKNS
jgi:hypothetical protein